MHQIYKFSRIVIKYLRKFLASILYIIPTVRMNIVDYPFSKEFKAINQDFISIGDDIRAVINKKNENKK
jgi:hypothetical protein